MFKSIIHKHYWIYYFLIISLLPLSCSNSNQSYNEAFNFYKEGKYENAKELFQNILQSNPKKSIKDSTEKYIKICEQILILSEQAEKDLNSKKFLSAKEKYLEIFHLNPNAVDTDSVFNKIEDRQIKFNKERKEKLLDYYITLKNYQLNTEQTVLNFELKLFGWGIIRDKYEISKDIREFLNDEDFQYFNDEIKKAYNKLNKLSNFDSECIKEINASFYNYQLLFNLLGDFGDYSKERYMEKFNDIKSEININLLTIKSHVQYLEKKLKTT